MASSHLIGAEKVTGLVAGARFVCFTVRHPPCIHVSRMYTYASYRVMNGINTRARKSILLKTFDTVYLRALIFHLTDRKQLS